MAPLESLYSRLPIRELTKRMAMKLGVRVMLHSCTVVEGVDESQALPRLVVYFCPVRVAVRCSWLIGPESSVSFFLKALTGMHRMHKNGAY